MKPSQPNPVITCPTPMRSPIHMAAPVVTMPSATRPYSRDMASVYIASARTLPNDEVIPCCIDLSSPHRPLQSMDQTEAAKSYLTRRRLSARVPLGLAGDAVSPAGASLPFTMIIGTVMASTRSAM